MSPSFFAPDADFKFHLSALEVQLQRNEGKASFSGLSVKPLDLPFVEKKLPYPQGIMVLPVAEGVGTDVHFMDEDFAVINQG